MVQVKTSLTPVLSPRRGSMAGRVWCEVAAPPTFEGLLKKYVGGQVFIQSDVF